MNKDNCVQDSKDNGAVGTTTDKKPSVVNSTAPFDSKKKEKKWKKDLDEEFKRRGL